MGPEQRPRGDQLSATADFLSLDRHSGFASLREGFAGPYCQERSP